MAQRTKALLSKIFNFAIDRQICSSNPVTNSIKIKANPSKDRFLSESEIKVLAKRLFASKMPSARLLLLILLTGQRPGEVAGMRWSELDQGIWNLPGARTKNKKSTVIPLSDLAQEIIAEQRKLVQILAESELSEDKSRFEIFVFPMIRPSKVTEDEHMAWFSSGTRRILTETKLAKFTPHDLRRTCATTVRQLGCSRDVVRSLLNHSNRSDVTAIYDRYDELEGKREALQKLADLVRRFRDDDCSDHPVTSNLYFLSKQAA